jgi:hypothetical protein
MDRQEQHHQRHLKQREAHKKEERDHKHLAKQIGRSIHPVGSSPWVWC